MALYDVGKLKEKLLYQEIEEVNKSVLLLKNGLKIELFESDSDCCASAYGYWVLNGDHFEGVITDVQFDYKDIEEYDGGNIAELKISIYHNQNIIAQGDCSADEGNGGYYFSVLSARVSRIDDPSNAEVIRLIDSYNES